MKVRALTLLGLILLIAASALIGLQPTLASPHNNPAAAPVRAVTPTASNTPVPSFTVNSTTDAPDASLGDGQCRTSANQCTLRAAIQQANASPSTTDIVFVPAGTYSLTLAGTDDTAAAGDLDITASLVLFGAGAKNTIIEDNANDRVLQIIGGPTTVTLSGVTVRNGNVSGDGGGIHNAGALTLNSSAVTGNDASVVSGSGGGIFNGGTLTINHSAIYSNAALGGAGIANANTGTLNLNSSTVSSNNAPSGNGGGISTSGPLSLNSSTVAANNSAYGGGGLLVVGGSVTMKNSILFGNTDPASPNCDGSVTSAGNNIVGSTIGGCSFTFQSSDQFTDPLLGALGNNGGPTVTHALSASSLAIEAGNAAGCTDHVGAPILIEQRGQPRHL
ncbi:MAG: choice-of-anchor Q domain-containing protein, partial [Chloroflexota bacterium]